MDSELYALVGKYGYKAVHRRLEELMLEEYTYLKEHFFDKKQPVEYKEIVTVEVPKNTIQVTKRKKVQTPVVKAEVVEIKDVIVDVTPQEDSSLTTAFRDPKEMKAYQKEQEEKKRIENETAGISVMEVLTKENLKQWIEVEGRTYAWVAREKAGCADTQVSATAQMLGIKSKISKKRGIMMSQKP